MADRMERLQILVTPEQRRRLAAVSQARSMPVTALVREAINESFPAKTDDAQRRAAADRILAMRVPHFEPEELNRILDERFDTP